MKRSLTLKTVLRRLSECLEAVKLDDKKLSPLLRKKLDYNIEFLRCYIELQSDRACDIQVTGFESDFLNLEEDQEDEDEFIDTSEYGRKPKK